MTFRSNLRIQRASQQQHQRAVEWQEALASEVAGVQNTSGKVVIRYPGSSQGVQTTADSGNLPPIPGREALAERSDPEQGSRSVNISPTPQRPGTIKVKASHTVYSEPQEEQNEGEGKICRERLEVERPEPDCCGITGYWQVELDVLEGSYTEVEVLVKNYGSDCEGEPYNGNSSYTWGNWIWGTVSSVETDSFSADGGNGTVATWTWSDYTFKDSCGYVSGFLTVNDSYSFSGSCGDSGGFSLGTTETASFVVGEYLSERSVQVPGNHESFPKVTHNNCYGTVYTEDCEEVRELGRSPRVYGEIRIREATFIPYRSHPCYPLIVGSKKPGGDEDWERGEVVRA